MKITPVASLLFVAGLLAGCYGTKPPPPQSSPSGPPGLSGSSSTTLVIPTDLAALLLTYRQELIAQSHHLSPQMATAYADTEITSLRSRYSGRDNELKAEVDQRLRRMVPERGMPPAGQDGKRLYPIDSADGGRQ
jgi:hypothetical protein